MAKKEKKETPDAPERPKWPKSISRNDFFVWLTVICLSWVCAFSTGVYVGRQSSPVLFDKKALDRELDDLRKSFLISDEQKEVDNIKKSQLDFYDNLKKDKDKEAQIAVKKPEPRPLPQPEKTEPEQKKTASVPVMTNQKPVEKQTRQNSRPETPAKSEQKHLTIQVASFKDANDADKVVEALKHKGFSAYRVKSYIQGKGTYYRVRVGSYKNRTDANKYVAKLKKERFKPFVVNE